MNISANDPWRIEAEARRAAREAEIGDICFCGEDDAAALIRLNLGDEKVRAYFEQHHVFGRKHDPDAELAVCKNCHAKAHYGLPRELFEETGSPGERLLKVWYIIAEFLQFIGQTMRDLADRLFPEVRHETA